MQKNDDAKQCNNAQWTFLAILNWQKATVHTNLFGKLLMDGFDKNKFGKSHCQNLCVCVSDVCTVVCLTLLLGLLKVDD